MEDYSEWCPDRSGLYRSWRDTIDQMRHMVAEMVGKRLMYKELVAD